MADEMKKKKTIEIKGGRITMVSIDPATGEMVKGQEIDLAGAGVLHIPAEMEYYSIDPETVGGPTYTKKDSEFTRELMETMMKPLEDPADAGTMKPLVITASGGWSAPGRSIYAAAGTHTPGVVPSVGGSSVRGSFPKVSTSRGGVKFPSPWTFTREDEDDMAEAVSSNMTKAIPVHAAGVRAQNGEWNCEYCGAEGFDKELFDEAGGINRCMERAVASGVLSDPSDVVNWARTAQARAWIEQMKTVREEVERFKPSLSKQLDSIHAATVQMGAYSEGMKALGAAMSEGFAAGMESTGMAAQRAARIERTLNDVEMAVKTPPHWIQHTNMGKPTTRRAASSDHGSMTMKWKSR